MFVKPRLQPDGKPLLVRDPNGHPLGQEGREVPSTPFWNRRVKWGDVVLVAGHEPAEAA